MRDMSVHSWFDLAQSCPLDMGCNYGVMISTGLYMLVTRYSRYLRVWKESDRKHSLHGTVQ